MIVNHLKPPYYAVIFSTVLSNDVEGYDKMAKKMEDLAKKHKGYLGIEHARSHLGITVSYWKDLESIRAWKNNVEHIEAQEKGKNNWYRQYQLRICKVEKEYGFKK